MNKYQQGDRVEVTALSTPGDRFKPGHVVIVCGYESSHWLNVEDGTGLKGCVREDYVMKVTPPMRHAVGDRVRVTGSGHFHEHKTGTVTARSMITPLNRHSAGYYFVNMDKGQTVSIWDAHLTKIADTPPVFEAIPGEKGAEVMVPKRKPRKATIDIEIVRARAALGKLEKLQRLALELGYTITKDGNNG